MKLKLATLMALIASALMLIYHLISTAERIAEYAEYMNAMAYIGAVLYIFFYLALVLFFAILYKNQK